MPTNHLSLFKLYFRQLAVGYVLRHERSTFNSVSGFIFNLIALSGDYIDKRSFIIFYNFPSQSPLQCLKYDG